MSYNVGELFRFEETEGGYALVEYIQKDNMEITEIEIPAEYNGLPVVLIENGVFEFAKGINRAVLPDTVTKIGDWTFYGAENLESVHIPDGVSEIGDFAFGGCCKLYDVNIPDALVSIGVDAFNMTLIKSVTLPKSLDVLDDAAFALCAELESVTFNSAPRFGKGVFFGCMKLPADVTLMGLVNSFDLSAPLDKEAFDEAFETPWSVENLYTCYSYLRPDVFKLAAENNCFRSVDRSVLLKFIIGAGSAENLLCAEKYGMFDDGALLDELM
ncbi:MAG: leucine-rich repeat domain-containing protein, partial [Oscillospiraceae bacterium]|nr:leucine-rich repeat domain-containing protein [Oscillospiraceae bacterium]